MPKIKSAKKAMRQARSRTVRNKTQRSSLRTALKHVRAAATADAAAAAYALAARVLDRAARKGLIHKNNAARQKSRLAALVKRLKEKASANGVTVISLSRYLDMIGYKPPQVTSSRR